VVPLLFFFVFSNEIVGGIRRITSDWLRVSVKKKKCNLRNKIEAKKTCVNNNKERVVYEDVPSEGANGDGDQ
jgi:hypothetical protein